MTSCTISTSNRHDILDVTCYYKCRHDSRTSVFEVLLDSGQHYATLSHNACVFEAISYQRSFSLWGIRDMYVSNMHVYIRIRGAPDKRFGSRALLSRTPAPLAESVEKWDQRRRRVTRKGRQVGCVLWTKVGFVVYFSWLFHFGDLSCQPTLNILPA